MKCLMLEREGNKLLEAEKKSARFFCTKEAEHDDGI